MKPMELSVGEPFSHPAWGSNFMVFSSESGNPIGEPAVKEYIGKATAFAKRHAVFLVPERFVLMNHHSLCLIGPEGQVLGAQQAIHLAPEHRHLAQGSQLDLIETPFGKVFLCVDVDVYYPEVAKAAVGLGADYIIASGRIAPEDYTNHHVIAGPWNIAQSNQVFVVAVSNMYHCVTAPRIIKQYSQGFVMPPSRKMPMLAAMKASVLEHLPAPPKLAPRVYLTHEQELLKE